MSSPTALPPITPVTADEPEARSADPVAANIQALKALFPDAFSEGGVDFDTLRRLMGDAVDDGEEKYGLNWSGKRRARRLALTPSLGTLLPVPEDSIDWGATRNLMIEGDNLEVLKLLQKSYAGKIKLIYIDPPYNTGGDFVYPDDYSDSLSNYLRRTGQVDNQGLKNTSNSETSGRYHTDWLNMMMPRLMLARNLLSDDGVIFISIDDIEVANLRLLCDELFGRDNLLAEMVWEGAGKNDARQIGVNHEYVIVYARKREFLPKDWSIAKVGADSAIREAKRLKDLHGDDYEAASEDMAGWYRSNKNKPAFMHRRYRFIDARGLYKEENPTAPGGRKFDLKHPKTGETIRLTPGRGWGFDQEGFDRLVGEDRITFVTPTSIMLRLYLHETEAVTPQSVFYQPTRSASERLSKLLEPGVFPFPKDEVVLQTFIEMASQGTDIILDFFAGSGTTGHAVMAQNSSDGDDRRYILVQLPEPLDPENTDHKAAARFCDSVGKPRTIAELTKERLRRAGAKVKVDNPGTTADLGFRVYKLATSNLKTWAPGDDLEADLLSAADNLAPGRTEDDLLVELLLKRGIDLAEPSQTREIAGRTVHAFGGGVMLACLGDVLVADAEALADGIANWVEELAPVAPAMIFFKDAGFENDVAKTNVAKILDQRLNGRGPGESHLLEAVRSV